MYLNLYQKYIMGLLEDYGCLAKRQLEFMTLNFTENHLKNIDGYLRQLRIFGKVRCETLNGEELVMLPARETNHKIIDAFDVMLEFADALISHRCLHRPDSIRFIIETASGKHEREINILPVEYDFEREMETLASDRYGEPEAIYGHMPGCDNLILTIFLVRDKKQMRLIKPDCHHSFAMVENGRVLLFEGRR